MIALVFLRGRWSVANAGLLKILQDEPRIFVESEDEPGRVLLETKINRDDGYQKQQGVCFVVLDGVLHMMSY